MNIDFRQAIHRKLFASLSPTARAAYDEANATYRGAVRSVAGLEVSAASTTAADADAKRSAAAIVLSAAIAQARGIEPSKAQVKGDGRTTAFSQASDFLGDAIQKARERRLAEVKSNKEIEADQPTKTVSLAELLRTAAAAS